MILFIPGVPQNSNRPGQWARFAKAAENKKFRALAFEIAAGQAALDGWEPSDFTHISIRQVSPVKRRRDPLGLAERMKGIMDGIVDAAVLPDDDEDHIVVQLLPSIRGKEAGIQLVLERATPWLDHSTTQKRKKSSRGG